MSTQESRPSIPEPTKREVRQRCGFGCVVCGLPIYEYEHMVEYSTVLEHTADNLTLLCPTHHAEKTRGLMPLSTVRAANDNPHNFKEGISTAYGLYYSGSSCDVVIGSCIFTTSLSSDRNRFNALEVDGLCLIGFVFQDEHVLLDFNLFDQANKLILSVVENNLQYPVTELWDVRLEGQSLSIRQGNGNIVIYLTFDVPGTVTINRGKFWCNGFVVDVKPGSIVAGELTVSNIRSSESRAGLLFGDFLGSTIGSSICFPVQKRDSAWTVNGPVSDRFNPKEPTHRTEGFIVGGSVSIDPLSGKKK